MIRNDDTQPALPTAAVPAARSRAVTMMIPAGDMTGPDSPASGAANLDGYLHALRRTWLWCLIAGAVLAAAASIAVFQLVPDRYTAVAELQAYTRAPQVLRPDTFQPADRYETFISNVQQLLQSRITLTRALNDPNVKNHPLITTEAAADPEGWLAKRLRVSNPRNSEIIRVAVTVPSSPELAQNLTNAVVNAYVGDIVQKERTEKTANLRRLEGYLKDQSEQEKVKRANLKNFAEQLGTTDKNALSFAQQIQLQQAQQIKNERAKTEVELMRSKAELEVLKAQLENLALDSTVMPEDELEVAIATDKDAWLISKELSALEEQIKKAESISTSPQNATSNIGVGFTHQRVVTLKEDLKEIADTLRAKWKIDRRKELEASIALKDAQIQSLDGFLKQLQESEVVYDKDFATLGKQSFELETMTKEIEVLSSVVERLSREAQYANVELASGDRIELISPAAKPAFADRPGRTLLAGMAGLLAFVLPGIGFVLLDIRAQRVNSVREVEHRLGLPVFGSVPMLPPRATRRLGSASRRGRRWQAALSEAISGIRANLLRLNDVRVVMVTSSVGGEGKTTVATQLAMSLARIGKRTALVDFDLPRPAINNVFDLPLEPGICDVLRNDYQLEEVLSGVSLPHLSVVTSGIADTASSQAMNSGRLAEVLDQLRGQFEYVIVDGSPLIPVADARVVSRYVDGVICCVLRDVSRLQLVRQAADILENFKVRLLGTVVTAKQDAYYFSYAGTHEEHLQSTGIS